MRKHAAIVAICLAVLAVTPRAALACSCIVSGPPCQEVFRSGAVFVGTVLSINEIQSPGPAPQIPTIQQRKVHLRVTEPFRGGVADEVDVITSMSGAACGYGFVVGGSYLVYASARGAAWSTSICSRTRPLTEAAEDLAFLRTMSAAPAANGRLIGVATHISDAVLEGALANRPIAPKPFAGARLSFTSKGRTLVATSDVKGAYALDAPAGEYQVRVTVPRGFYTNVQRAVTLEDTRGCAAVDVYVRDDGHIRGRVVDAGGKPVPNLAVGLGSRKDGSRIEWDSPGERTDADGRYEFSQRAAGAYLIGVNTVRPYGPKVDIGPALFLPGALTADKAEVVALPSRATIDVPDFVLPDAVQIAQIVGIAVDDAGVPVSGVRVYLQTNGPELRLIGPGFTTGPDGVFAFGATADMTYKIVGEFPRAPAPAFTIVELRGVRAVTGLPPLKLQLPKH